MKVKIPKVGRSVSRFNLSHSKTLSGDMGYLIPILCEEVVPSDTWDVRTDMLIRLSPLVTPVMHEINVHTEYFFVPNRIICADFEEFITGGDLGTSGTLWSYKSFSAGTSSSNDGTLADYLGFPNNDVKSMTVSAFPFRAYSLIWNEWYRDQQIQSELTVDTTTGLDTTTNTYLKKRNWPKDYFTAALPTPQKGTAVDLPLGTSAPLTGTAWVKGLGVEASTGSGVASVSVHESDGTDPTYTQAVDSSSADINIQTDGTSAYRPNVYADLTNVTANLATATAATINELRNALAIQRFMERSARGGSRYHENTLMNFGVLTPDHRLNRPEYLGGGKSPVVISEVLATSGYGANIGDMKGHGISAAGGHGFRKSFTEHGWIIGLMTVMPKTQYQQGLPRKFTRDSKFDYLWPDFVNIGEQEVLNQELYVDAATPSDTFGYQERYAEYRYIPNSVHGEFRSTAALANWHMGRIFTSEPSLNSSFLECDPTTRVFANIVNDTVLVQLVHNISALRPLPKYAEPQL